MLNCGAAVHADSASNQAEPQFIQLLGKGYFRYVVLLLPFSIFTCLLLSSSLTSMQTVSISAFLLLQKYFMCCFEIRFGKCLPCK